MFDAAKLRVQLERRLGVDIECNDGWLKLINNLDRCLEKLHPTYRVTQCKEKFGSLRYYTWLREPFVRANYRGLFYARIAQAELDSMKTCEYTGKPGVLCSHGGWLKVLCKKQFDILSKTDPERWFWNING